MKIGLLNLEPKYKNLAIEKLRLFYSQQGDMVEDYFALRGYDKVYASSIFKFTEKHTVPGVAVCGGTGFDLLAKLPPEIDAVKPHLNFGFTTRGCIRKCKFCVVPEKEGGIVIEGDLLDIWDGRSKLVTLHDNNILAVPEHFEKIYKQALEHRIKLDFNQGLDFRLLTPKICQLLKSLSHVEYHFSFDEPSYQYGVERAINLLNEAGIKRCTWYILTGFSTTLKQDLDRCNFVKSLNQNAFVQRYKRDRDTMILGRWANQHHIFQAMTFEQFIKREYPSDYDRLVVSLR